MQNQIQKYEKLDMNVSLMRIIACLIVIGCHVRISPIIGDSINKPILYLHDFFDDGVAIFFCIVGFFLYNNKSYKNLWKKAVKNILIPAFLLTMISILLSKFIEGASLLNSIKDSELNFGVLLRDFVSIDLKNHNFTGHLWYITSYFELIIFFPVTKLIINEYEKGNKNILNWVLGIGIFDLVVNDVQALYMLPCGEITVHEIFPTPQLLCLIGYRIYIEKDKIKNNKKCRIFGLLGMLVANTIRFFAQYDLLKKDVNNEYFYYWRTAVGCAFTISFILFFLSFDMKNRNIKIIINYIGAQTFFIYLIHMLTYAIVDKYFGRENIIQFWGDGTKGLIIYCIMYPIIIFGIALGIKSTRDLICYGLKLIGSKMWGNNNEM